MDIILKSLLHDWDYLYKERDALEESMPGYSETCRMVDQAEQELEESLSPEQRRLLRNYSNTRDASASLLADASLLCGGRVCLRLLVNLL